VKITDSKGLVVRVGGTVHVAPGGTVTPPFDPTPLNDAITALTYRTNDNDARLNDLTDASPVEVWDVAAVYPAGTVMRHNGSTWLAKVSTTAGDEPTPTSAVWRSITLEALDARISGSSGGAAKPKVLLAKVLYAQLPGPMTHDAAALKMDALGLKMFDQAAFPAAHLKEFFLHPDFVDDSNNTGGLKIVDAKTKFGNGDFLVDWSILTRPKAPDPTALIGFWLDIASDSWNEPYGYRFFQQTLPYAVSSAASGRVMFPADHWESSEAGFMPTVHTMLPNGQALYEAGVASLTFRLMFVPD
jgi:hypothetical protein